MLGSLCVLLFVAAVIRNGESIVNDTETVNAKGGSSAGLQCSRGACFPLYYILGAPKAGSSSLWELFNALYKKQPRMSRRLAAHDGTTRSPILKHRAKRDVRRDPDAANLLKKTVSQVQRSEKQMSGRPAVGKQNRSVQSILPVVLRHQICTAKKEMRFWSDKDAFIGSALKNENKLTGYLKTFQSTPKTCPFGRFMEATPTYLGDWFVPSRMAQYYPEYLKGKLRFVSSLRHPVSRDLSWFNVLYNNALKASVSIARDKIPLRANTAGIVAQPIMQLCLAKSTRDKNAGGVMSRHNNIGAPSEPVVGSLYAPSGCYDRYVASALTLFQQCADIQKLADTQRIRYTADIKAIISGAVQKMGRRLAAETMPNFDRFISKLVEITFVYERCSYSSILRTGLYAPQVVNWLHYWHPRQLLFLSYADLFERTTSVEPLIKTMFAHFLSSDMPIDSNQTHEMEYLLGISSFSTGSSLPHSNPTRGSHKIELGQVSCSTFCALNRFYEPSSRLTVGLLRLIYGELQYNYSSLLSLKTLALQNCSCNDEEQEGKHFISDPIIPNASSGVTNTKLVIKSTPDAIENKYYKRSRRGPHLFGIVLCFLGAFFATQFFLNTNEMPWM